MARLPRTTRVDDVDPTVYEPAAAGDGTRILVERLWPGGLSKDKAARDHWLKDVAPSPELRRWYGHEPERWPAFQERYRAELAAAPEALARLEALCAEGPVTFVFAAKGPVTFVFAAKNQARNSAVVLRDLLAKRSRG